MEKAVPEDEGIEAEKKGGPTEVDFSEQWDLSDVSFLVEDRKVYANKGLLSMWSPVMKAMFFHDFKEKGNAEVELPGKRHEDIVELMKVLHPPNKLVTGYNVAILLPLAREYQMTSLTQRCEDFLLSKSPSVASLVLADEYSLTHLQKACLEYTKSLSFDGLSSEDGFEDLVKDTKIRILLHMAKRYDECMCLLDEIDKIEKNSAVSRYCPNSNHDSHLKSALSTCPTCSHYKLSLIRKKLDEKT